MLVNANIGAHWSSITGVLTAGGCMFESLLNQVICVFLSLTNTQVTHLLSVSFRCAHFESSGAN